MDDNVEDCPVCLNTFDDTHRRPRNLPCGHTLCTPCINELKEQGAVTCPTCRVSHALPEAGQFPISYITEAFIRKMRGAGLACVAPKPEKQLTAPAAVTQPAPRATAGLSKRTRSLLQEQEARSWPPSAPARRSRASWQTTGQPWVGGVAASSSWRTTSRRWWTRARVPGRR
ncbi:RING finger protein 224-like [Portunus trituberculatus]|uniref:RING finger protein 224-like n=1 Tax=Portunus trituberculatus TaxID=210409 RepID=UPI001E1D1A88|nr:RING finger protein 224-like [Portunus trituberculatus]